MTHRHRLALASLAVSLFLLALSTRPSTAQPTNAGQFKKNVPSASEPRTRINDMRDGKKQVVKVPEEAKNKADLALMAQSLIYPVTDPVYYYPAEPKGTDLKPVVPDQTIQARLNDLEAYVLVPSFGKKLNFDQFDYIVEFGAALDKEIRDVMAVPGSPFYIRVNAARMLALAARSGAPAHAKTVAELIANPETKPEVLAHALHAAEGLLAAFDPRKAGTNNFGDHIFNNVDLIRLVQAVEGIVTRGVPGELKSPPVVPKAPPAKGPPDGKAAPPPMPPAAGKMESTQIPADPEAAGVARYIRRLAIRALAQVRFPRISSQTADATKLDIVRPLWTLARVAMLDPSLSPTPGGDEVGEAVIGLCNLHKTSDANPAILKDDLADTDVVLYAVATGVGHYARKKVANIEDKSIPWRGFSARIALALTDWQKRAANDNALSNKIGTLASIVTAQVLTPIEKSGSGGLGATQPGLEGVEQWREQWRTANGMKPLQPFTATKDLVLKPGS